MKKYLQVIKLTLEEYLVYRLNFVLWRFRSLVFFLSLVFFWLSVYGGRPELLGYQKSQMLTYVVGIAFLKSLVLGSRSADLAGQIRSGSLSWLILKPVGVFKYWLGRDVADKLLNLVFSVVEVGLILKILGLPFYIPSQISSWVLFMIFTVVAVSLYFTLSLCISISGFWTEDIWATRWLVGVIFLEFLAGAYFPIDVLPMGFTKDHICDSIPVFSLLSH